MPHTGSAGRPNPSQAPVIGITCDIVEPKPGSVRAACSLAYADAVRRAGGLPVLLPPDVALIEPQLHLCDGFVLTGGDDPRMEMFGEPTHPKATVMHPRRQDYETTLIRVLLERPQVPVLGICLGMQLLALVAGGRLDQHMPDNLPSADRHAGDQRHTIEPAPGAWLPTGEVTSHHRQAVTTPGTLAVAARGEDGVIEAIERPGARFCLGVQWHPERTADKALGDALFQRLVEQARAWRRERASAG